MAVFSFALLHTLIGVVAGALFGLIISGLAFYFFGWLWSPVVFWGLAVGVISGVRAYRHATTPWRG